MLPALAALFSSFCCLPLGLGVLGLGSLTLAAWLQPLRPYLLGATLLFLAGAFYQAYRPEPPGCAPDGSCSAPPSRRRQRVFLWVITFVTLTLVTFPYWASWLIYWML